MAVCVVSAVVVVLVSALIVDRSVALESRLEPAILWWLKIGDRVRVRTG